MHLRTNKYRHPCRRIVALDNAFALSVSSPAARHDLLTSQSDDQSDVGWVVDQSATKATLWMCGTRPGLGWWLRADCGAGARGASLPSSPCLGCHETELYLMPLSFPEISLAIQPTIKQERLAKQSKREERKVEQSKDNRTGSANRSRVS